MSRNLQVSALVLIGLISNASFACRDRHFRPTNTLLSAPVPFDPTTTHLLFGDTTEYEVLKVLSGEQDTRTGHRILERRSFPERQQTWQYLEDKLVEFGYSPQRHEYRSEASNLWAVLNGTVSTNEYVVIGAHFDSVGNAGANDNASGVAVVMSLAERLQQVQVRNKNVLIVFLDEEERGLVGANFFAKYLKTNNYKIHSVHTIDQIAWDKDKDRAIELEKAPDDLMAIYTKVKNDRGYMMPLHYSPETSTDHSAFRNLGFKAMGLTEEYRNGDTTPCYHSKCDKFETVDFDYLTNSAKFWSDVIGYIVQI